MTGSAATTRLGFRLRVPESWYEFDVWRATRTGDLARMVDARIGEHPELAPQRGALLKALRAVAEHADRHGALRCAVLTDPVVDAGTLLATAMVFRTEGRPDPGDTTVEAIASQITAVAPAEGSPYWRTVRMVDVPAGRAVRVAGVDAADPAAGVLADGVTMQTLIPIPDETGVLSAVLASPQTQLAEPMLTLFEAISDTLAWSPDAGPGGDAAAR